LLIKVGLLAREVPEVHEEREVQVPAEPREPAPTVLRAMQKLLMDNLAD
jgi:hypothetical protein